MIGAAGLPFEREFWLGIRCAVHYTGNSGEFARCSGSRDNQTRGQITDPRSNTRAAVRKRDGCTKVATSLEACYFSSMHVLALFHNECDDV